MIGIDSSTVIDFFKGNPAVKDFFLDQFSLAQISYFEVLRGEVSELHVDQLYSLCEVHDLTQAVMKRAVRILKECEKKGTPIPVYDALIAASFLSNGITEIVTNDKHFSYISGLKVLKYAS